jgi:hypothetical protein
VLKVHGTSAVLDLTEIAGSVSERVIEVGSWRGKTGDDRGDQGGDGSRT